MNTFKPKTHYFFIPLFLLCMLVTLAACAHKAKVIQVGAAQFEAESLAAIEKIDRLRQKEVEAMPLPPEKASELFVKGLKNSSGEITLKTLRGLIEPLKTETPVSEAQWQAFLLKMRQQYTTFAATFASLDMGYFAAASNVKKTAPILDKLISQMAAFAQSTKDNPAEFLRERSAIAAEIEKVRDTKPFTEVTDLKFLEIERRLREIDAAEKQITRETIEQALKAATLGTELRNLLMNYSKLSIDDISEGLSVAFRLAGSIPGLDISELKARTDDLVKKVKDDDSLRRGFETAVSEIQKVRISLP